jgi:triacylglycerol lipase
MQSEHLIDPELAPLLELIPPMELSSDSLNAVRDGMAQFFAARIVPENSPVTVTETFIPGPAGAPDVRVLMFQPIDKPAAMPAMLHLHGGGYVFGSPDYGAVAHHDAVADLGCTLVSVDYRLAPEAPPLGQVEDCYAALKWLFDNAAALGVDKTRIGVTGESAGGGLAACLALLARDRGEVQLSFQHLIYPMLDDRTCTNADAHPYAGEYIWTPKHNQFGWASHLGTEPGGANISPYAAAARAENLIGLPPAFISVGALDLFLEEDMDYARRLTRAGVPVELHVYPGAFHAFDMSPTALTAVNARRDSREALRRALNG